MDLHATRRRPGPILVGTSLLPDFRGLPQLPSICRQGPQCPWHTWDANRGLG